MLGFFFHRYEADQTADLAQIRQLFKVTGQSCGPIWFSGQPWAELATAAESARVVVLPYLRSVQRKLARRLRKRQLINLDLPMGIGGTCRFVRELAQAVACSAATAAITARPRLVCNIMHDDGGDSNFGAVRPRSRGA